MYTFNYHKLTHSIYFIGKLNSKPVFTIDTFKVQEHILLYVCIKLTKFLNIFNTCPSDRLIRKKFNLYCNEATKL